MKNITIAGGIGKDAETRTTQNGDTVVSFGVGVQTYENGQKGTQWFDVSWWGQRAAKLQPYLTKGSKVCVTGDLGTREYNGKTYLTVRANDVTPQGGGQGGQSSSGYDRGSSSDPNAPGAHGGYDAGGTPMDNMEDEIPF